MEPVKRPIRLATKDELKKMDKVVAEYNITRNYGEEQMDDRITGNTAVDGAVTTTETVKTETTTETPKRGRGRPKTAVGATVVRKSGTYIKMENGKLKKVS